MSTSLLDRRAVVFRRLADLLDQGTKIANRSSPTTDVEYEHALEAAERWAEQAARALAESFQDVRVVNDVAGGFLRQSQAEKQHLARHSNMSVEWTRTMLPLFRAALAQLARYAHSLDHYDEPRDLPLLAGAELIQINEWEAERKNRRDSRIALDAITRFNKGMSVMGPGSPSENRGRAHVEEVRQPTEGLQVFVSHSSQDALVAEKLVDLLVSAFDPPLLKSQIRCTSVDGCKLQGGDRTQDRLRAEIKSVPVFIALITKLSVEAVYVLFELGGRWLSEAKAIPVMGPGADFSLLPGPWKGQLHALRTDERTSVLQLIHEIGVDLGRSMQPAHAWDAQVQALVSVREAGEATGQAGSAAAQPRLTEENVHEYLAVRMVAPTWYKGTALAARVVVGTRQRLPAEVSVVRWRVTFSLGGQQVRSDTHDERTILLARAGDTELGTARADTGWFPTEAQPKFDGWLFCELQVDGRLVKFNFQVDQQVWTVE